MRKRVNKIISVALSATLAFGVFTALPMSANAVVSTASEVFQNMSFIKAIHMADTNIA